MNDPRLLEQSIPGRHHIRGLPYSKFKAPGNHISNLRVWMGMQRSDIAFPESDLDHHYLIIMAENLPLSSTAGILPRNVRREQEIFGLL